MTRVSTSYHDPVKARLSTVEDLKPAQWAGTVRTVAAAAARHDWPMERVIETLAMLGLDAKAARDAKAALRRSIRLRMIYASVPTPKAPLKPPAAKPAPKAAPSPSAAFPPNLTRERAGRFVWVGELCARGLHPMTGENRTTRPDRSTAQCRACTLARRQAARDLVRRQKAAV